jgi:hypothetical protein
MYNWYITTYREVYHTVIILYIANSSWLFFIILQEAYLPPVLRTKREANATSDDSSPPQLTRRKTYGSTSPQQPNDHVIDATNLTPSTETVVSMGDEDKQP